MMAFLLDIITFLQISFSTNIFRINYKRLCIDYKLS
ncbi:rRNA methyltransferase [Francisella tularensis subsp. holarctica FSC022]|nr:rRNA methyltransferase [Francisella tularensis subsp. holarctica FSC022]